MRFEFKPSFEKSIKKFSSWEKEEIKNVAIGLIDIPLVKGVFIKGSA